MAKATWNGVVVAESDEGLFGLGCDGEVDVEAASRLVVLAFACERGSARSTPGARRDPGGEGAKEDRDDPRAHRPAGEGEPSGALVRRGDLRDRDLVGAGCGTGIEGPPGGAPCRRCW